MTPRLVPSAPSDSRCTTRARWPLRTAAISGVPTCNGAHFGGDGGVAGVVAAAEDGEDDDDGDDGEVRCLGDSNSSVFGVGRERVRVSE